MRVSNTALRAPALAPALLVCVIACGCSQIGRSSLTVLGDDAGCVQLDSLLARATLAAGVRMAGKATIDVEQYRVRGHFTLTLSPGGDLVFEITSTTMLGGHREDAVLSFYADTLRVLDREGGNYYEGDDVDALVADGLDQPVDIALVLRRATGRPPDCRRVSEVALGGRDGAVEVEGRVDGKDFALRFDGNRMVRSVWPLPRSDGRAGDTLDARYEWRGERLTGLVLFVPEQRWRIKLVAE